MKQLAASVLIVSFVGIVIFGFALFTMGMNHRDAGCVAAAINGTVCPTNVVDFARHHISALQSLTTTVVPPMAEWLSLLASLLLVPVFLFLCHEDVRQQMPELSVRRIRDLTLRSRHSQQKIVSWFSRFELSPAR